MITISAKGFFNHDTDKFLEEQESLGHLNDVCEIAPGTTLEQLFTVVESLPSISSFVGLLANCDPTSMHERVQRETEPGEIVRIAIVLNQTHNDYYVSKIWTDAYNAEGKSVSTTFVRLAKMKSAVVELEPVVTVYAFNKPVWQGRKVWTVMEALVGLYDDLSFMDDDEKENEADEHGLSEEWTSGEAPMIQPLFQPPVPPPHGLN